MSPVPAQAGELRAGNGAACCAQAHRLRPSLRSPFGVQAKSLYLSSPELSLGDALQSVGGLVAPEHPNGPGYPILRNLLLRQVYPDFFRQVLRHELSYLPLPPVGTMAWEWRQGGDLRVFGEEISHGVRVPAPPGVLEGERREELLGLGLAVRRQVFYEAWIAVQLRSGAKRA